jgi:hypothetical protein
MSREDVAGLLIIFAMSGLAYLVCYSPVAHWLGF